MLVNCAHEFGAVSGGAAIFRLQDDITHAREDPGKGVEPERIVRFRPAVRQNHKRVGSCCLIIGWESDDALQGNRSPAKPANGARLTQGNLCELIVALAGDLLQRLAVYDRDIGSVLRIGNREGLHIRCASDLR